MRETSPDAAGFFLGYDIRRLPVATLWNSLSLEWPMQAVPYPASVTVA
jgi:hypothetical protein